MTPTPTETTEHPNILVLMCDQMQAQVLEPGHACLTPNLDNLAGRGLRFERAYSSNAICAPARASLMTGLLPHNHGVVDNFHYLPEDQANLHDEHPHWAQCLMKAGYHTGYFGKWHVSRKTNLDEYGWQCSGIPGSAAYESYTRQLCQNDYSPESPTHHLRSLPGYKESVNRFYYVTEEPAECQAMGVVTSMAGDFLKQASGPWCCFVSFREPHDPFHAHRNTFNHYDVNGIELPASVDDALLDRPGVYRKVRRAFGDMGPKEMREAAACYYACITDIDRMFGKLLSYLDETGQRDNTIVIMLADHGEMLGAHGLYCKNIGAFEEVYNVPMILAGPGIVSGATTKARVSSRDLCPTILELVGCDAISNTDSQSFADVLKNPKGCEGQYTQGFAEYYGGRYNFTQRITYDDNWKFVFNGFDFDELYNLADDPHEMRNLANDPAYCDQLERMYKRMWSYIRSTGDTPRLEANYPGLRTALYGPELV